MVKVERKHFSKEIVVKVGRLLLRKFSPTEIIEMDQKKKRNGSKLNVNKAQISHIASMLRRENIPIPRLKGEKIYPKVAKMLAKEFGLRIKKKTHKRVKTKK
jgi:hypothetical protein